MNDNEKKRLKKQIEIRKYLSLVLEWLAIMNDISDAVDTNANTITLIELQAKLVDIEQRSSALGLDDIKFSPALHIYIKHRQGYIYA